MNSTTLLIVGYWYTLYSDNNDGQVDVDWIVGITLGLASLSMESFVIGGYRERSKASFGLWKKKTQYENELHFSFSMMYCSDSAENPLASIIIIRLANLWEGSFFLPDFTHNYPALTSSHKKSRFTRNPNEVFKLSPVTNGSLPLFYRPDLYLFWKKKTIDSDPVLISSRPHPFNETVCYHCMALKGRKDV